MKTIRRQPPEGLFGRLLDGLPDIYTLVLDQKHRIVYANIAFLEHFGLTWRETSGKSCLELGNPFSNVHGEQVGFCPAEQGTFYPARTILTQSRGKKQFFYEVTHYRAPNDDAGRWTVSTFRDVTHRFNLESQLRQLDELEHSLIQASMDGIIVNDMLGRILIFNQGAARILGYSPDEVIGKINASQLYPGRTAHDIKEKIYSPEFTGPGMLENYETVVRRKDGTMVPIWLSARILHEGEREVGIVGFFRDLRERKRLEEELVQSERLASLGKMVAHISHEIKNPLMTIGGFARQLERLDLPKGAARKLELIHQEVQRLEKFLSDLSTFTRVAPAQKAPGDLLALIQEVAELMDPGFKEQGIVFRLENPQPVPPFLFDRGQIRQVLINVFKNAQEAMPQGGELTVRLETVQDRVRFTTADTGNGIPAKDLESIFTPFFSTKEGGTGLGLTICRNLIEQHQGTIEINSEEGRGTTCTIHLPLDTSR